MVLCLALAGCPPRKEAQDRRAPQAAAPQVERGSVLQPAPRQPGPPREETPAQLALATQEALKHVGSLLQAGIQPREVASVADTLGYRLYRQRNFGQARKWFEAAINTDATFELSLYNAARCAALMGDLQDAVKYLQALQRLKTPLSRSRLIMARTDPDLSALTKKMAD